MVWRGSSKSIEGGALIEIKMNMFHTEHSQLYPRHDGDVDCKRAIRRSTNGEREKRIDARRGT